MRNELSREQQTFLTDSQCGYDTVYPLVCCQNTFSVDDLPSGAECIAQLGDKIVGGEIAALNEFPWYAKCDN